MKLIEQNPFRTLGVPSNALARVIEANRSRLKAFLRVNRPVSFPLDCVGGLSSPTRNVDLVEQAITCINLPKDKLTHAFFWFIKPDDSIGSMAWEYLLKGDVSKADELFAKRDTFSSLINRGVLSFISGKGSDGIKHFCKVIQDNEMRDGFAKAINGETFQISEDEIAEIFFTSIFEELDAFEIFQDIGNFDDQWAIDHIRKFAIQKPIAIIEEAICKAKSTQGDNPIVWWESGNELLDSTQKIILQLATLLGNQDPQYQRIADKLANQILQCSISYFNSSDEGRGFIVNAKKLAESAAKIAMGKLATDRCNKAVETLTKKERDLPPIEVEAEAIAIFNELRAFVKKPDKIEHSVTLLNNTKPQLQVMKTKLGVTNSYYLKLSTQVVSNALHNVIEEVNSVQNSTLGSSLGSYFLNEIRSCFKAAWNATLLMDKFDIDDTFRYRYNTNRQTLKNLCEQIGISTNTYAGTFNSSRLTSNSTSSFTSSSNTSSSSGSSSDFWDDYGGCLIQLIIYGIIAICIATCS